MEHEHKEVQSREEYVYKAYTEFSPLTGLYYNRAFFKMVDERIDEMEKDKYALVAIDIAHFRLLNKLYGRQEGDNVLVSVANELKKVQERDNGVAGYLGGDNFCIVMSDDDDKIKALEEAIIECLKKYNRALAFYPVFGVYSIVDTSMLSVVMYDHATMAISRTSGALTNRICRYSEDIEEKIEEELDLLAEIQVGLENEEFTFFAQPQCDISTGKIIGAESLVRWKHSTKGLVSPGLFIPVLEKNDLISELDRYVWKKVCKWIRSWMDRGYHPVPISINVSRLDVFAMDVPGYLKGLVEYYNIQPRFLKVEITESAYAEHEGEINKTVNELREYGFTVMMDDFGSGYSSLNMLKSVAVDVLKLDMKFLDIGEEEEEKGIGIIESVVNMARLMGLPIIVEGVENQKQEQFLLRMGCRYTQGYYYYRPLPIEQFEELLSDERRLDYDGIKMKQVESIRMRELMDGNMYSDAIINNMLGAMAYYDVYDNQIEVTRVNEQYYKLTGHNVGRDGSDDIERHIGSHVRDDDKQKLLAIFDEAYRESDAGSAGHIHFITSEGKTLWVYIRIFFLSEKSGHRLYYGTIVDMTKEKIEQKKNCFLADGQSGIDDKKLKYMEKYYGDMPNGYTVGKIILDEDNDPIDYSIVYANKQMEDICGGNLSKFREVIKRTFASNPEEFLAKAYAAAFLGEKVDYFVYSDITNRYLQLTFHQFSYGFAGCVVNDITHTHIYEDALNGVMSSYLEAYYLDIEDNYFRMIHPNESDMMERGDYEEAINRHFGMGKISTINEKNIRKFLSIENIREQLKDKDSIEFKYRRKTAISPEEWCLTTIRIAERVNDIPKTAIIYIKSIENIIRIEEEEKVRNVIGTIANMKEGFCIHKFDGELLYANSNFLNIYGYDSMGELLEASKGSLKGLVFPDDARRCEWEIKDKLTSTDKKMEFVRFRIYTKSGEVRWIEYYGRFEGTSDGGESIIYAYISDITDTISLQQEEKLIASDKFY